MLEEALIYLEMGWCIYPAHYVANGLCSCGRQDCPTPGKHPIGRWLDFQKRLPTKREVTLWFESMQCNIGTVTGSVSHLIVVDVDNDQGKEAVRQLDLPKTLMARTGGGGYHFFYRYDDIFQSKTRITEGVDIRGEGGYVVLPPSRHLSGRYYEWLKPRKLAVFDPKPFQPYLDVKHSVNGSNWSSELLQGVPEGNRSVSASRLAGRYFNLGLSYEEVWVLMKAWNEQNMPPLALKELDRTVRWVKSKHIANHASVRIQTLQDIRKTLSGE